MTRSLLVGLLLSSTAQGQFFEQYFDPGSTNSLPYSIDTAQAGNLWQVGAPQKVLFSSSYSPSRAIVTDTLNTYPTGDTSSFTVSAPVIDFGFYPLFFLSFRHAFDTDTLQEGGYVEVSWDNGMTWNNVFNDWLLPTNIEIYNDQFQTLEADTLSNGQMGFSGSSGSPVSGLHWVFTSVCWTNTGIPFPADTMQVRFTFFSDTVQEQRDGWMIDDIQLNAYFVHPVLNYLKKDDFLKLAPNPVADRLNLVYDIDQESEDVDIALFDAQGRLTEQLVLGPERKGVHHVSRARSELPETNGLYYLKARVGGRNFLEPVVLQ